MYKNKERSCSSSGSTPYLGRIEYLQLSFSGGSIHDKAFNGVYDFGGSCGIGRSTRSSVLTRYFILNTASSFARCDEYTPVIVTSVSRSRDKISRIFGGVPIPR